MSVQIWVSPETRTRINDLKRGTETQDDVVKRLLDYADTDPKELVQESTAAKKELDGR